MWTRPGYLRWKRYVRVAIPSAAILLPAALFFSVLSPHATDANGFIYLLMRAQWSWRLDYWLWEWTIAEHFSGLIGRTEVRA